MIPRLDLLIKDSRLASLQEDYGDDYGIGQDFFAVTLRNAQRELQTYLVKENDEMSPVYYDITVVSGQSAYALPSDIFAGHLVYEVRFSSDSTESGFSDPLDWLHTRPIPGTGDPRGVFVDAGYLYLDYAPTTGKIRIRYEQSLPAVDLRRGVVKSVSMSSSYYIELSTIADGLSEDPDDDAFDPSPDYVCLVDSSGAQLESGIPVVSYSSSTRYITFDSSYVFTNSAASLVGAFVVLGYNSSTHFGLDDVAESYLIEYCKHQVALLTSSTDASALKALVDEKKAEIAELYSVRASRPMGIYQLRGED